MELADFVETLTEPRKYENKDKRFNCTFCDRGYTQKQSLNEHVLKFHTPKENWTYRCAVCDKVFSSKRSLSKHKFAHMSDDIKLFRCNVCDKKFGAKCFLKQHMLNHLPEQDLQFECDVCNMKFLTKAYLNRHSFTHIPKDDWPFQCSICNAKFHVKCRLRKHIYAHNSTDVKSSKRDHKNSKLNIIKKDTSSKISSNLNLLLIDEVKKYPVIYDTTTESHSKQGLMRTDKEEAWEEIAKVLNSNVAECKDRWRNLRITLMRAVKNNKKYYLYDAMKFVLPFLNSSFLSDICSNQDSTCLVSDASMPLSVSSYKERCLLIAEIEKYPVIYNNISEGHNKRNLMRMKREAWEQIAIVVRSTVAICKLRWKHLRNALIQAVQNHKKYHFYDVMKFVLPFLNLDVSSSICNNPDSMCLESNGSDSIPVEFHVNDSNSVPVEYNSTTIKLEAPDASDDGDSTSVEFNSATVKLEAPDTSDDSKSFSAEYDAEDVKDHVIRSTKMFLLSYLETISSLESEAREEFKIRMIRLLMDMQPKYS